MIVSSKPCIHPYNFVQLSRFSDVSYPADITDAVRKELKDVHPSMFIGDSLSAMLFKITYSYVTNRGTDKVNNRYVFLGDFDGIDLYEASIMAETRFISWVDDFNWRHPYRAISNVKILEIAPFAKARLFIG